MKLTISFLLGLLVGAASIVGFGFYKSKRQSNELTDTTHITIYDTLSYRMPIAHDSVVIRYLDKHVAISDTIVDTIIVNPGDSIPVKIPITQKEYRDSTYEAWISGYEAKLDSINVFNKTITHTIYKQSVKTKKWGAGIHVGYGYGLHGFSPYVGIGIQYNILNW